MLQKPLSSYTSCFSSSPSLLLSLPMQIFIEVLLRSQKTKVSFLFPLAKRKSTRSPPFPVQRVAAYLRIYRLFIPVFEGKPRKCSGLFFTPQKSSQNMKTKENTRFFLQFLGNNTTHMRLKIDPSSTKKNKLPENIFCPQFGKEEQKHLHPPFPFPFQNTPDFPRYPSLFLLLFLFPLFTLMGQITSEPLLFLSPSNKNKKVDPISIFFLTLIRVQEHLRSEVLHREPGGRHRRRSETVFASGKPLPPALLQKEVAVARPEGHVRLVGADGLGA